MNINTFSDDIKKDLSNNGYSIAIHGIDVGKHPDINKTAQNILNSGLTCNYNTIYRTAVERGRASDVNAQSFVWSFNSSGKIAHNIILAIPDTLKCQGVYVPLFAEHGYKAKKVTDDGACQCIFDDMYSAHGTRPIIVPPEYIYGYYTLNEQNNEIGFTQNKRHISKLSEQDYSTFAAKTENLFLTQSSLQTFLASGAENMTLPSIAERIELLSTFYPEPYFAEAFENYIINKQLAIKDLSKETAKNNTISSFTSSQKPSEQ